MVKEFCCIIQYCITCKSWDAWQMQRLLKCCVFLFLIKHEYLRSRASRCLSLSSSSGDFWKFIKILVLTSWILHPRILFSEVSSVYVQVHIFKSVYVCSTTFFVKWSKVQTLIASYLHNNGGWRTKVW